MSIGGPNGINVSRGPAGNQMSIGGPGGINISSGPGGGLYFDDSGSESGEEEEQSSPFVGISINSNNNYTPFGNNFVGVNFVNIGMPGRTVINGRHWGSIPQSQWPGDVMRDYQQGMAAGARAMGQAENVMNSMGLSMGMGPGGMGMGMGGRPQGPGVKKKRRGWVRRK
jgi:hypothetical protein